MHATVYYSNAGIIMYREKIVQATYSLIVIYLNCTLEAPLLYAVI